MVAHIIIFKYLLLNKTTNFRNHITILFNQIVILIKQKNKHYGQHQQKPEGRKF